MARASDEQTRSVADTGVRLLRILPRRVWGARSRVLEMSASMRDERWGVYDYSDSIVDGRANPGYSRIGTWWARSASPSGREATLAGQANQQIDVVVAFAKEAVIPANGFLRAPDDKLYRILTVLPIRGTGSSPEQQVLGVYSDDATQSVTEDPTNVLTYLGNPLTFGGNTLTFGG